MRTIRPYYALATRTLPDEVLGSRSRFTGLLESVPKNKHTNLVPRLHLLEFSQQQSIPLITIGCSLSLVPPRPRVNSEPSDWVKERTEHKLRPLRTPGQRPPELPSRKVLSTEPRAQARGKTRKDQTVLTTLYGVFVTVHYNETNARRGYSVCPKFTGKCKQPIQTKDQHNEDRQGEAYTVL